MASSLPSRTSTSCVGCLWWQTPIPCIDCGSGGPSAAPSATAAAAPAPKGDGHGFSGAAEAKDATPGNPWGGVAQGKAKENPFAAGGTAAV